MIAGIFELINALGMADHEASEFIPWKRCCEIFLNAVGMTNIFVREDAKEQSEVIKQLSHPAISRYLITNRISDQL